MGRRGRWPRKPVRGIVERDKLVLAHLDVPPEVVKHMWGRHASLKRLGYDDAVQIANLGLLRAASLWEADGVFRRYAYSCCEGTLRVRLRRGVELGPKEGDWDLVPQVLQLLPLHYEMPQLFAREENVSSPSTRWLRLLAALPDGLEKKYLEARASGLSCYEAGSLCGMPGFRWEGLNSRAIKLARSAGKEIGL